MLEHLLTLFAYNAWASRRVFDALAAVPGDQYLKDLKSSHGGIHGTLCHIVWAEQLWLHRWLEIAPPAVAQGKDLAALADVRARWEEVEGRRREFLRAMSEARLAETRSIKPTTGGEFVHTFREMFHHLVNHSSYHRGQIVALLRQLGHKPPSTDLILFFRERGAGR